jgi:hypothetical protein
MKWEDITLAHVKNAVLVVHHFIYELITHTCPDERVRSELWSSLLEDLTQCYRRAMDHAKFLLHVELDGKAVTCNPEFERLLTNARSERVKGVLKPLMKTLGNQNTESSNAKDINRDYIRLDHIAAYTDGTTNVGTVCGQIHDVLESYYTVARSRFVDNICSQVVDHFLLSGNQSPLRVFSPGHVLSMKVEKLDMIAGEDAVSRSRRETLTRTISKLKEAKGILQG